MGRRLSRKAWDDLKKEVERRLLDLTPPAPIHTSPCPVVQRSVFNAWSKPRGHSHRTSKVRSPKRGQLRRMVDF